MENLLKQNKFLISQNDKESLKIIKRIEIRKKNHNEHTK